MEGDSTSIQPVGWNQTSPVVDTKSKHYRLPGTLMRQQKILLDKIGQHCSWRRNAETPAVEMVSAGQIAPELSLLDGLLTLVYLLLFQIFSLRYFTLRHVYIVRTVEDFEEYFKKIEDSRKARIVCSREQDILELFKECKEIYSSVLGGVECMQSSFSTIKIALSHTKSVAEDLKDHFYKLNTEMSSLLKVIGDIDAKLSRYSKLSDIKRFFDRSRDLMEGDSMKLVDMIKSLKNFHDSAGPEVRSGSSRKYAGGTFSCMLVAVESISTHVCNMLNGIKDVQDISALSGLDEERFLSEVDAIYLKFAKVRKEAGVLLDILCEETKKDSRFLQYKVECVSSYNTSLGKNLKPQAIEKYLRGVLNGPKLDMSIASVFTMLLCLESRRRHSFSIFFAECDNYDATLTAIPQSLKRYMKSAVANATSFDTLSKIYRTLKAFLSYPDDELDSRDNVLSYPITFERIYDSDISKLPSNGFACQFSDLGAFYSDKLVATAYEYASHDIQNYRMAPSDILLFVMDSSNSYTADLKTSIIAEHRGTKASPSIGQETIPFASRITYDPKSFSNEKINLNITHLRRMAHGDCVKFGRGLNYPTALHTVYMLRKMYECLDDVVYGDLGEHTINMLFSSLVYPFEIIHKNRSHVDAILFLISNLLSVYSDLCMFLSNSMELEGKDGKCNILPLKRLEDSIAVAAGNMIENLAPVSSAMIEDLIAGNYSVGNVNTSKGSEVSASFSTALGAIVDNIRIECSDTFRKFQFYLSDAAVVRQIAQALVNKIFASIRALEDATKGSSAPGIVDDAKDEICNSLLEQLESLSSNYSK